MEWEKKGGVAQDLLAVEMIFAPFVFHIGSLHTYPVFFDLVLESLSGDLELFGSCVIFPSVSANACLISPHS